MKPRQVHDLVIVGGGASGMAAAVEAARAGVSPLVLERMDRVGRKILATGNGRCNLTHLDAGPESYHGAGPDFVRRVLERFGSRSTLRFFEEMGLEWRAEEGGRVFPATDQASAVLDLLRYELNRLQVECRCDADVEEAERAADGFRLTLKSSAILFARVLVLAAGGRAVPSLGSNGSGFRLARGLGHEVVEPMPAVVQIRLRDESLKKLKGIRIQGRLTVRPAEGPPASATGEILFTEYGLSGPPALRLSRLVNQALSRNRKSEAVLDFFPDRPPERFRREFASRLDRLGHKSAEDGLVGLVHKRLVPVLLEKAMIDRAKPCGRLSASEAARLSGLLKAWAFEVLGTRSWLEAQVTAGGVDASGVNPESLESKAVPGLFFAGEILDVDGDSGGYNLEWAWSSGRAAGGAAAARVRGGNTAAAPHRNASAGG